MYFDNTFLFLPCITTQAGSDESGQRTKRRASTLHGYQPCRARETRLATNQNSCVTKTVKQVSFEHMEQQIRGIPRPALEDKKERSSTNNRAT